MGKINLIIANATASFSNQDISIFQKACQAAEAFISRHFTFDYDVDLIVTSPSSLESTIPEDGIGGRTYNSRLIIMVVDPEQSKVNEDVVFEFICHELSHSLRWEKVPEYANTLFENIILEGLGIVLEEKALEETGRSRKQFFLQTIQETDHEMIDDLLSKLSDTLDDDHYDYFRLFFTGDDELPRWTAYRLGYHFVKKYLKESGQSIEQATLASYRSFSH